MRVGDKNRAEVVIDYYKWERCFMVGGWYEGQFYEQKHGIQPQVMGEVEFMRELRLSSVDLHRIADELERSDSGN